MPKARSVKPAAARRDLRHKHAFVGTDTQGDACIYVLYVDKDGTTGDYLPTELLQKIADRINNMRIGL